jgi:hypothetical protein
MKRPPQPEEISPASVFLAAPSCSSYIPARSFPSSGAILAAEPSAALAASETSKDSQGGSADQRRRLARSRLVVRISERRAAPETFFRNLARIAEQLRLRTIRSEEP